MMGNLITKIKEKGKKALVVGGLGACSIWVGGNTGCQTINPQGQAFLQGLGQAAVYTAVTESIKNEATEEIQQESAQPEATAVKTKIEIIPPQQLVEELMALSTKYPHYSAEVVMPEGDWNIGIDCICGNVRDKNDDYAVAFEIQEYQVVCIADGCGGMPHGDLAAYLAVRGASESIVRSFTTGMCYLKENLDCIVATAMRDAYDVMGKAAYKHDIQNDSMHTTLIIVVASPEQFAYGYIGDGGGYILNPALNKTTKFLEPQKDIKVQNELHASLGPIMAGNPVIGVLGRKKGDILLVGTDGVFDFSEDSFPRDIVDIAMKYKGNLQQAVEKLLEGLANNRTGDDYTLGDNLTLAIIGDKNRPIFNKGFSKQGN